MGNSVSSVGIRLRHRKNWSSTFIALSRQKYLDGFFLEQFFDKLFNKFFGFFFYRSFLCNSSFLKKQFFGCFLNSLLFKFFKKFWSLCLFNKRIKKGRFIENRSSYFLKKKFFKKSFDPLFSWRNRFWRSEQFKRCRGDNSLFYLNWIRHESKYKNKKVLGKNSQFSGRSNYRFSKNPNKNIRKTIYDRRVREAYNKVRSKEYKKNIIYQKYRKNFKHFISRGEQFLDKNYGRALSSKYQMRSLPFSKKDKYKIHLYKRRKEKQKPWRRFLSYSAKPMDKEFKFFFRYYFNLFLKKKIKIFRGVSLSRKRIKYRRLKFLKRYRILFKNLYKNKSKNKSKKKIKNFCRSIKSNFIFFRFLQKFRKFFLIFSSTKQRTFIYNFSSSFYFFIKNHFFSNLIQLFFSHISFFVKKFALFNIKGRFLFNPSPVDASLISRLIFIKLRYKRIYFKKAFGHALDNTFRWLERQDIVGMSVSGSGRFTRRQRAISFKINKGRLCFSSVNNSISFSFIDFSLKYGACSVKIWVAFPSYKYVSYSTNLYFSDDFLVQLRFFVFLDKVLKLFFLLKKKKRLFFINIAHSIV